MLGYNRVNSLQVQNISFIEKYFKNSNVIIYKYQPINVNDPVLLFHEALDYINYLYISKDGRKLDINSFYIKEDLEKRRLLNSAIVPITNELFLIRIYHSGFYWLDETLQFNLVLNDRYDPIIVKEHMQQDHRLLRISKNDIIVVFTADLAGRDDFKIGISYLSNHIHKWDDRYRITEPIILFNYEEYHSKNNSFEKNWSPFNYKTKTKQSLVFFIQFFEPFHVIEIDKVRSREPLSLEYHGHNYTSQFVRSISKVSCHSFQWNYGMIRGGTPALLIRGQYLGFFHSSSSHSEMVKLTYRRTYFMGAYTFSTNIPFRMTSMSKFPIYIDLFTVRDDLELIIFPVSYFLRNHDKTVIFEGEIEKDPQTTSIVLSVGHNNDDTAIVELNLNEVLNSMRKLLC